MKNKSYEKTLHLLLAGRHPKAKKFAGKHILFISNEVIPLRKREDVPALMGRLGCIEEFRLIFDHRKSILETS